ncbi:MAG: hypothetical protein ABI645_02670 [Pseudomonadota bacterium]
MNRSLLTVLLGLLLVSTAAVPAQPRVFYSPTERPGITANRKKLLLESLAAADQPSPALIAAAAEHAEGAASSNSSAAHSRLDGISLARDGNAYAWIGGRRYDDGSSYGGRRLRVSREGIRLQDNQSRLIRVGEMLP